MKTILLVEDDPFLIDIYSTKMKDSGFEVDVAVDGEEALKKIEEHNQKNLPGPIAEEARGLWPDIVVMDLVLPRIDGWEVLKRIKGDAKFKELKLIVLSNLGQKNEVEKGLELGATKYLIKAHYTPSEVIQVIKEIIQ